MYANTFSFAGVTHDHNFFAENRRVEGCDPPCDKDDEGALDETDGQVGEGSPFVMDDMSPLAADSTRLPPRRPAHPRVTQRHLSGAEEAPEAQWLGGGLSGRELLLNEPACAEPNKRFFHCGLECLHDPTPVGGDRQDPGQLLRI